MSEAFKILVVDDDADIWAGSLEAHLHDLSNIQISSAYTPDECRRAVARDDFAIILVDIAFSPNDAVGLALVPEIQAKQTGAKIFMLSSHDDEITMVRSLKAGALDFISKRSAGVPGMARVIRSYIDGRSKRQDHEAFGREIADKVGAVVASRAMIDVFTAVAKAHRNPRTPVLITGETGVGKDVIASAVALRSDSKQLIAVDCGAISESLADSELFGHVRGAFTGADSAKTGKFQLAHGGDLFLDEIGNLKRSIQDKLLRVLQNKEITPIGGTKPIKIDVGVIAATNEDLNQLVERHIFRQDLLERLKGTWIRIPPLRERQEDFEPLTRSFIRKSSKPDLAIEPNCLSLLKRYSWPGNVRELDKVIGEMVANVDEGSLTLRHLPEHFAERLAADLGIEDDAPGHHPSLPGISVKLPADGVLSDATDAFLAHYLRARFQLLGNDANHTRLARDLQISRTTLIAHLKRLNIDLKDASE